MASKAWSIASAALSVDPSLGSLRPSRRPWRSQHILTPSCLLHDSSMVSRDASGRRWTAAPRTRPPVHLGPADKSLVDLARSLFYSEKREDIETVVRNSELSMEAFRRLLTLLDRHAAVDVGLEATRVYLQSGISRENGDEIVEGATLLW